MTEPPTRPIPLVPQGRRSRSAHAVQALPARIDAPAPSRLPAPRPRAAITAPPRAVTIRRGGAHAQTRPRGGAQPPLWTRPKARRVILVLILAPVVALLAYNVLTARATNVVKIGETAAPRSGLELTVGPPQKFALSDTSLLDPTAQAYQVMIVVNNHSGLPVASSALAIDAKVNGVPAKALWPDGPLTQDIQPGVQLNIPFRFQVQNGTSGALEISVTSPPNEPVVVDGTI